jgi:hypothetical protein
MSISLEEARTRLLVQIANGGVRCPCCQQFAKIYRRQINAGMAISLIRMFRRGGLEWMHIPTTISARSREEGKLAYWGLLEEATEPREDGGRAGYWRVTVKGAAFITRGLRVPKYAKIYDGQLLELEADEMVNIRDCLGKKFELDELMRT